MILESWNLRYLVVLRYNFWNVTELFEFWNRKRDWSICVEFCESSWRDNWMHWNGHFNGTIIYYNGITRSVLCCLSLSNVCSVIVHSDYTLSWTKCKLFDAGWLGQIVRFWYEFDHHSVTQTWIVLNSLLSSWGGHLFSSTFWQCLMSYLHFL